MKTAIIDWHSGHLSVEAATLLLLLLLKKNKTQKFFLFLTVDPVELSRFFYLFFRKTTTTTERHWPFCLDVNAAQVRFLFRSFLPSTGIKTAVFAMAALLFSILPVVLVWSVFITSCYARCLYKEGAFFHMESVLFGRIFPTDWEKAWRQAEVGRWYMAGST